MSYINKWRGNSLLERRNNMEKENLPSSEKENEIIIEDVSISKDRKKIRIAIRNNGIFDDDEFESIFHRDIEEDSEK